MALRAYEDEIEPGETIIPLIEMERVRRCIRKALIPDKESEVTVMTQGDVRKGEWTFAALHSGSLFDELGHLEMVPGWSLVGAAERQGGNGMGTVFAVREGREGEAIEWLCESCASGRVSLQDLRNGEAKPPESISVVMNTFTGPSTAESFAQASLMWRQLLAYGASWHGIEWEVRKLIDETPWDFGHDPSNAYVGGEICCDHDFWQAGTAPGFLKDPALWVVRGEPLP